MLHEYRTSEILVRPCAEVTKKIFQSAIPGLGDFLKINKEEIK